MSSFRFCWLGISILVLGMLFASHSVLAEVVDDSLMSTRVVEKRNKEVPLTGEAWRLADQAYKNYDAGRLQSAQSQAERAIRLRPDIARLRLLLVFILQKRGKLVEANAVVEQAIKDGLGNSQLLQARNNLSASGGGSSTDTPAYRKAFPIATRAYDAFNQQRFEDASRDAEVAYLTDPSQGNWALLWLDALDAQQKYEQTAAAAQKAIDAGAPNRADLEARQRNARRSMAIRPAEEAHGALMNGRLEDALSLINKVIALAPDSLNYRLVQVTILVELNRLAEAEQAATDALDIDDESVAVQVLRAYVRQRKHDNQAADEDFDAVLALDWLDETQVRNVRLLASDAAIASGRQERALGLLSFLPKDDELAERRRQAARRERGKVDLSAAAYMAPFQVCRATPYGTVCEMQPWDGVEGSGSAAMAYIAYGRQQYQQAIEYARQAVKEQPDNVDNQRLLMTALSAGNATQQKEAEGMLIEALEKKPDDVNLLIQRAYLSQRLGQPRQALQDFKAARATGKAPPTLVIDEAYAFAGVGNKQMAVDALKHAIDEADDGHLPLTQEQRYNTRAGIAGLSREWGASYSVGYRGARPASSGAAGAAVTVPGNAVFGTAEAYWRPADFLNTSTRVFEIYGRLSNTLYDEGGRTDAQTISNPCGNGSLAIAESQGNGLAGWPTTVAALGARLTPSTSSGFTFGLERRFNLGHATRRGTIIPSDVDRRCALQSVNLTYPYQASSSSGNWMAYMTYGFYEGTGLRMDERSWWTMEGYMQAGYITGNSSIRIRETNSSTNVVQSESSGRLRQDQSFAAAEVRVGRSMRLDDLSERLVVFPYVVGGIDWLWQRDRAVLNTSNLSGDVPLQGNGSSWALGAGPGINVRYWFREDRYNAPRSYIDWTLQYRINIGGGDAGRARGLFMNMTFSY
ncbi:peptidase [Oxalicibacterium flavum]|uniref:Peptidase n=1 Tax=Oxalicibacterium flavum TaxID=179467 RepID=A0A8J2UPI6_9BURK|nr:hypothetical protein [Oxalicibacterium flavum]GGC03376.1 peptidase [Oxalicibacterium flavum]